MKDFVVLVKFFNTSIYFGKSQSLFIRWKIVFDN